MAHDDTEHNAEVMAAWDRKMAREQEAEDEYEKAYADVYRQHGVVRGGTSGTVLRTCKHRHADHDDAFLCAERELKAFWKGEV